MIAVGHCSEGKDGNVGAWPSGNTELMEMSRPLRLPSNVRGETPGVLCLYHRISKTSLKTILLGGKMEEDVKVRKGLFFNVRCMYSLKIDGHQNHERRRYDEI